MTDTLSATSSVDSDSIAQERRVVTAIPGPKSVALHERRLKVVPTGVATTLPVYIERAHGAIVVDVDGNQFIDLGAGIGVTTIGHTDDAVVAAATGKVIYVGKEPRGYGQMIVVNHAKETVSVYFHTDKVLVKEQQRVLLGQKLAEVADGAGNKMHFEVRRQGKPLDPVALMPR